MMRRPMSEDDPNFDREFDAMRDRQFDFCPVCDEPNDYCVCGVAV